MASCQKCGGRVTYRRPDRKRKCKRCGFLPGTLLLARSGDPRLRAETDKITQSKETAA